MSRPPLALRLEARRLLSADLQISMTSYQSLVGEFIPITGTIVFRNTGDLATPGTVDYRVWISRSEDGSDGVLLDEGTVPAIEAGNSQTVNGSYAVPSGLQREAQYYLVVRVDPDNTISESNNSNNDFAIGQTVIASLGSDSVVGTEGSDYLSIEQIGDALVLHGVPVNGRRENFMVRSDISQPLTITLLGGNDTVVGWPTRIFSRRLHVDGGDGNDRIDGSTLNDTLLGGAGSDTLVGNAGDDELRGGSGNDLLFGQDGNDYLAGNAQSDTMLGGNGNDTLSGNGGRDRLRGNDGSDLLMGGDGGDVLSDVGSTGVDLFSGGRGHDLAYADADDILASIEDRRGA